MRQNLLTTTQKRLVDKLESETARLSAEIKALPIHVLIRLLRKRLFMTQKNLAKRAGIPQPTIARIESGREKPKIQTLETIFAALFCDTVFLPIPKIDFKTVIQKQARKAATSRLEYIKGTMALEEQLPSNELIEELISQEQERLIQSASSEIWEY